MTIPVDGFFGLVYARYYSGVCRLFFSKSIKEGKMKEVIRYLADDGKIFETSEECLDYEVLLTEVTRIGNTLVPPGIDSLEFRNGEGYIQLPPGACQVLRDKLTVLTKEHYPWASQYSGGMLGRALSDSDTPKRRLLYRLWCWLDRIDDIGRLWGQPYYTRNGGRRVLLHTVESI